MFVGFDFLHATMHEGRKEFLTRPFYHWSSNHRGKMAKYKSACLLYVFVPCFFQVFHVSQTFSVSLVMACIFFKWGVATPIVNAFFVGNGLNCLEKMGQFYTENLGAWQSCEKRDLSRMVSEILCPF